MKTAGIIFLIMAAACLITGSTVIGGLFWLALGIAFLYKVNSKKTAHLQSSVFDLAKDLV